MTGLLVSAFPAVNYLNLYYRSIELCKSRALSENLDFDQALILSPQAKSDLHWIINNLAEFNGCFFGERPIDIYIECDASLAGWGASCGGQSANSQWSILEAHNHINYLELLAALYALQAFVPNLRDVHVRLKLDNSTAVAYVNKMGGIKSPSLNSLSRTLWEWCIKRNIIISAQHIPRKENLVADTLSREFSSNLEWSVDIDIFNQITNMTFVPDIDLFASRLNAKTDCFVSWHPEPGAMAVDAFSISWANLKCYAFPPFSLLTQVLAKIRNDKALVLLIAPVWTTQNWYPLLLQLAVEQPILLPRKDNLLTQSFAEGRSYSTINTYRSALSSTLYPVNNVAVGSHPLVVRLLKGIYHLRTPLPRYSSTWDVAKVTNYLRTLFPLEQLNLL